MTNNLKDLDWRIWNKNHLIEERSYKRAIGELPEMESAKQLRNIIGEIDDCETILDVGCAVGHYLRSIRLLNPVCHYVGVDATHQYIDSAVELHAGDQNARFYHGDVFDLNHKADIVFCCNLLLHLPELRCPLENLLASFNDRLIVRTLMSQRTHLSQYLYDDKFDASGNPKNFQFQNTYSFDYVKSIVNGFDKDIKISFLEDEFIAENIQNEGNDWRKKQGFATTSVSGSLQIAGDKVFRWAWMICTK